MCINSAEVLVSSDIYGAISIAISMMIKFTAFILLCCLTMVSCADTRVPRPTTIRCQCMCKSNTFVMKAADTLSRYGFSSYEQPNNYTLKTVKSIDDGLSVRTIYITAVTDSSASLLTLTVKTIVRFRNNTDTVYYDESIKIIPDNRQDFVPVFNALRTLCKEEIPLQPHQKKRQVVPWKR